ncbi:hypothetical protein SAMN05877753_1064 [Bacillus oleivorans]|uniref:Uncharacterized protein n=1 Tax=Bacillus oleivorans TaxID=1448271 RepID=A0A285CXH7_9BACI|nr:hypothetical protein [Bacillus oleivorans]SNX72261.1 hypothetical protein SAMN05877753_1064 [Bacillus oleivorans]
MQLEFYHLTQEQVDEIVSFFDNMKLRLGNLADEEVFHKIDLLIADIREYDAETTRFTRTNRYLLGRLREFGVTFDDVVRDLM